MRGISGILFGLLAVLSWGAADFFVVASVRRTSVFKTFIWSQIVGAVLLSIVFSFSFELPIFSFDTIVMMLVAGLLGVVSYLAFYKGLQTGKVSIISPIAACWSIVTVMFTITFLGESLSGLQLLGVSLAILGAVLASFRLHDLVKLKVRNIAKGVEYALLAVFSWGIYFVLLDILVAELNWLTPILFTKVLGVVYLLSYSTASKKEVSFPREIYKLVILIGALEVLAFLSYGLGISSNYSAIVAPIGAAFPVITLMLARIFYKEKLELNQKLGVISVMTGIVLLSLV